jgi:hypothetical protein
MTTTSNTTSARRSDSEITMAGPFLGPDLHAVGRQFQTGAPVRLPIDDDEAVEADAYSAEQSAGPPLDPGGSPGANTSRDQCSGDGLAGFESDRTVIEAEDAQVLTLSKRTGL